MPSMEFHWKELTQPMSLPPQPKYHWTVLLWMLMILSSKDKEPGLNPNWKTLQKQDWKELNKANKLNLNGEKQLSKPKRQLMLNFCKTSRKSSIWEDIWEQDSLFSTTADHTNYNSDDCKKLFKSYFYPFPIFLYNIILECDSW